MTDEKMFKLEAEHIYFAYKDTKPVLVDVSLSFKKGQWLTLLGNNGAGKTTLLKCILQQLKPTRGTVTIDGKFLHEMSAKERARHISYVPQSTRVPFAISVMDAVLTGRLPFSPYRYSSFDYDVVEDIIVKTNLSNLAFRNVNELSGGERQRVWIARALAQGAPLLCMDEPTTAMDPENQVCILELIDTLVQKDEIGVMMILHDLNLAGMYSDYLSLLHKSKIFIEGSPKDVLTEENIYSIYRINSEVSLYRAGVNVQVRRPESRFEG